MAQNDSNLPVVYGKPEDPNNEFETSDEMCDNYKASFGCDCEISKVGRSQM